MCWYINDLHWPCGHDLGSSPRIEATEHYYPQLICHRYEGQKANRNNTDCTSCFKCRPQPCPPTDQMADYDSPGGEGNKLYAFTSADCPCPTCFPSRADFASKLAFIVVPTYLANKVGEERDDGQEGVCHCATTKKGNKKKPKNSDIDSIIKAFMKAKL